MDDRMRALIDAPLGDPAKRFVADGKRRVIKRGPQHREHDGIGAPKVSREELDQRKASAAAEKRGKLYDYYATTDLSFEKIAQHMGVYRQEQTGVDDKGKPVLVRVLDVRAVEAQISWRRRTASGIEARQRTDPEEGLDPKGESPTAESGDAQ